ncbi:AsmA-like C-terminal region-containing protein [Coraliomargarita algicola]|uniref:AsmA-like C-terminal region-containing protein n=1 Tax=Coraliomargarita algicola TaxID=3092156 RepID=A0ABZ0RGV3_9BACT|nr:AsmA-like C-terminal region-containing protein [Coraliomargarita sp. J2-16]WPJ94464.1 AsmA-like C-terminal region-containing protein [Coraliomargarita sp. J2-16]
MALLKKLRLSTLLELFWDASLLLIFITQALVIGCILIYGYLPLPTGWSHQVIAQKLPPGIIFTADEFRLQLDGSVTLVGVKLRSSEIQQNLLEADALEVQLAWQGFNQLPSPAGLVLTAGTLYIPSVYSPDGYRRAILERIAFRIAPDAGNWNVERFAALNDDIRLRGSFHFQSPQSASAKAKASYKNLNLNEANISEWTQNFYSQVAQFSQYKKRISYFKAPTVAFTYTSTDTQDQIIDLHLSSRQLRHPEVQASNVELQARIQIQDGTIRPLSAPRLTCTELDAPRFQIQAEDLSAEFPRIELNGLLSGHWPPCNLAAKRITLQDYELDAPTLQINPKHYPEIAFHGSTRSLNGAIALKGRIDAHTHSGHVRARGSIDLASLTPETIRDRLPDIAYETPPYLDVQMNFDTGFSLNHAAVYAQVDALKVDHLTFDHINTHATYQDGQYTINNLYLRRQKQWIDLKFSLDSHSHDYKLTLYGTAVPYDYNAILPRWWGSIFKDFDFSRTDYSLGDFIIYGNTQRKVADLYYGHAEASNVSYRDIAFDAAELIVRGRGPYCELRDIHTRSGQGWAHGKLAFASRIGDGKGPVSLRLDMDAKLTLEDAAKLFKGTAAQIIADFETDDLPVTKLKGAIFNSRYPEYQGKSFFDLSAALDSPLKFRGVPLDHLSFDLYGRSHVTHLREVELGYADGQGSAQIDIYTPPDSDSTLRYEFSLKDADQNQALRDLPQLDNLEHSLETTATNSPASTKREDARVDIQIHGEGPTKDPFKHTGFGNFEIRNDQLGTIQLLGPLSKFLQNTYFNFTSFNLNQMRGDFHYENDIVHFDPLRIDGTRTQINAPGTLRLSDQALNMRLKVSLFANSGNPDSNLRKISDLIIKPLPNLLEFELTGTLKKQKLRSLYDPRNLIPLFE